MKFLRILIAVAALASAVSAFALSPEHEEWAKSPVKFLMTQQEVAQWKAIKSDEDAAKFIALFWARRDPSPDTRANEFRDQFASRVRYADDTFLGPNGQKGSLTDRGKTFILFGPPTRVRVSGTQRQSAMPGVAPVAPSQPSTDGFAGGSTDTAGDEGQLWIYEGDLARKIFEAPKAEVQFVDRHGKSDFRLSRGTVDYAGAEKRAIARAVTQPDLTEAPNFAEAAPEAMIPTITPILETELTTDSLKSAVAAYKASPKSEKAVHAAWGEFVTADGETFVPVLLYIPKSSGTVPSELTFFGVVEDASGKNVLAFEEPAKVTATKDDSFVEKSLKLSAGKHRGIFGIAEAGKPIAITSAEIELAGTLDKDATAASQLILSNNIFPLAEAQLATDPFAFGGLKVVPKADKTFRPSDELWYFIEMRNPGLTEGEAPRPNVQVKLDVAGKDTAGKPVKMSAPLMEVAATEVKGVPNHYAVGSSIPLATFRPGEYTFNVKIIDTVKKASYTLSETFKVVE